MAKIKTNYAEITVGGNPNKPYFSIRYFDPKDRDYHYGFGSYDIKNVFKWLEEEFEIVDEVEMVKESMKRNIEKEKLGLTCALARVLSDIEVLKANVYKAVDDLNTIKTEEDLYEWHATHDIEKGLLHIRIVGDEL